jgi:hypothetical protein
MIAQDRGPPAEEKQASGATVRPITPRPSGAAEGSGMSTQQIYASYSERAWLANSRLLGSTISSLSWVADTTSLAPRVVVRSEEASMHTRSMFRSLFISLTFVLIAFGLVTAPAARAAGTCTWSEESSREDVPVQACGGFAITSSYTTIRAYHIVADRSGATVFEREQVNFTGAIANATTGKSFGYDGHLTRSADYDQGKSLISDLLLRFRVDTPNMVTISFARVDFNLVDSPPAVIQAIVPTALQVDLCTLLGNSSTGEGAGTSNLDQPFPLSIPDPCDIGPRDRPC